MVAGEAEIRARRFVVATGSSPFVPPIPGLEAVPWHTNETIFTLRECPGHLLVIGGGPSAWSWPRPIAGSAPA